MIALKIKQIHVRQWLALLSIILICGCNPFARKNKSPDNIVIEQGAIDGKTYYVPKDYFKIKGRYFSNDNIYLHAMYPNFTPVMESPQKLWKEKEWYRNIRILAEKRNSNIKFHDFAENGIKNLKAFEVVGNEYGLVHQKQSKEYVQDHHDIWLEEVNGKHMSYITCSEKIIKIDVPHCNFQLFIGNKFWAKISFNKRLLPHWKEIKRDVLEMFSSFESEKTAREYINRTLDIEQNQK